ncbi:MAG: hypothetical protein ACE5OZ_10525 [Candidatus Heimdallarchaeota archaeon]
MAQENSQKTCVIFGLPYRRQQGTQFEQENGELFGIPIKNIGTYPNHGNNTLRCDLDDFLTFYGNDKFAIGCLWPPMLILNGTELIRWNNSVRAFLQRLAQDDFSYCLFETEWTTRLSFALGWATFDQRVLVLDPSCEFPPHFDCLPWHGKSVLFLAPSVSPLVFQPEKWLPEALRSKPIEFVLARSELQDQPLRTLWQILQKRLIMPVLT